MMKNTIFKFVFMLGCVMTLCNAGTVYAAWDTAGNVLGAGVSATTRAISGTSSMTTLGRMEALRSDSVYANLGYAPAGPAGNTSSSNILRSPGSWAKAYGTWGDQDDIDNDYGFEYDVVGFMVGYDVQSLPNLLFGVNAGYSYADIDSGINTDTDIDTITVGLYASYSKDQMYIDYGIMYSHGDIDNDRTSSSGVNLESYTDSDTITAYVEAGKQFQYPDYILTPFAGVTFSSVGIDDYAEKPTNADALLIDDTDDEFYSTTLGVKAEYFIDNILHLKGRVTWNHEFSNDLETTVKAASGSAPTVYRNSEGIEIDEDRFGLGVGLKYQYSPEIIFDLDYDLELAEDFDSHSGTIGIKYLF